MRFIYYELKELAVVAIDVLLVYTLICYGKYITYYLNTFHNDKIIVFNMPPDKRASETLMSFIPGDVVFNIAMKHLFFYDQFGEYKKYVKSNMNAKLYVTYRDFYEPHSFILKFKSKNDKAFYLLSK